MPPRTARETFLALPVAKDFAKIAETDAFEKACQYSLLVMMEGQQEFTEPNQAWGEHRAIMGAKRLCSILRTLHIQPEQPKQQKLDELKFPARKPKQQHI